MAVTAAASATAGSAGAAAGASGSEDNATTVGAYHDGVAVFTIAKGGIMYQASVGGEKFTFERRTIAATRTADVNPVQGERRARAQTGSRRMEVR